MRTAGDVMDMAASLMNDTPKSMYTYSAQMPYMRMAGRTLDSEFQANGFEVEHQHTSPDISVSAGDVAIVLPNDFFLPLTLMERYATETSYIPMHEVPDVNNLSIQQDDRLGYWDFRNNNINLVGSTADCLVSMEYIGFEVDPLNELTSLSFNGCLNWLGFKTAAFLSKYIARDAPRALALEQDAGVEMVNILANYTKNLQGVRTRRKPFIIWRRAPILIRIP